MRFLSRQTHRLWASWLTALASGLCVGVAQAEQRADEPHSGVTLAPVAEVVG